jgi:plasmid stabilization system protein ParE
MKRLKLEDQATREIDRAVAYHERQRTGLGGRLREEIEETCRRIQEEPSLGPRYLFTKYQFVRTKVFPYVVIYRDEPHQIAIMPFATGASDQYDGSDEHAQKAHQRLLDNACGRGNAGHAL